MKTILKFEAPWCAGCKVLSETLGSIKIDMTIDHINVDDHMDKAKQYNVRNIPTLIMLEDDIEVKRSVGSLPRQKLVEWLSE